MKQCQGSGTDNAQNHLLRTPNKTGQEPEPGGPVTVLVGVLNLEFSRIRLRRLRGYSSRNSEFSRIGVRFGEFQTLAILVKRPENPGENAKIHEKNILEKTSISVCISKRNGLPSSDS